MYSITHYFYTPHKWLYTHPHQIWWRYCLHFVPVRSRVRPRSCTWMTNNWNKCSQNQKLTIDFCKHPHNLEPVVIQCLRVNIVDQYNYLQTIFDSSQSGHRLYRGKWLRKNNTVKIKLIRSKQEHSGHLLVIFYNSYWKCNEFLELSRLLPWRLRTVRCSSSKPS